MASTGSSLAAETAGIIPDTIPMMDEIIKAKNILPNDSINTKSSVIWFPINMANQTNIMPIKPPNKARIIDSNKN